MKNLAKIFALLIILSCANVEAATFEKNSDEIIFQELRSRILLPVLPDRIRHRKDSRRLQRPAPKQIEVPSKKVEPPKRIYTQKQPKQPPRIKTPKLPQKNWAQRGSHQRKRFGPPRF